MCKQSSLCFSCLPGGVNFLLFFSKITFWKKLNQDSCKTLEKSTSQRGNVCSQWAVTFCFSHGGCIASVVRDSDPVGSNRGLSGGGLGVLIRCYRSCRRETLLMCIVEAFSADGRLVLVGLSCSKGTENHQIRTTSKRFRQKQLFEDKHDGTLDVNLF